MERLNYNHATNKLQPNSNLNTWQFSYGPAMTLTAPWYQSELKPSISSRRGYSDSSMNTDEFVWNAQLSGFPEGQTSYHHAAVLRYSPPAEHLLSCHFCYIPHGYGV